MAFDLLHDHLTPAEGETTVRSYHCTSLSSWLLSLKAEGYLTVTNKRLVFYASGSSLGGKSILHSEVPIADVSGINSYKGTHFSFSHLLTALVVSFVLGSVIAVMVSGVLAVIGTALVSSARNRDFWSLAQNVPVILAIGAVAGSFLFPRNSIVRPVGSACGAMLLIGRSSIDFFGGLLGSLLGNGEGGGGLLYLFSLLSVIYTFVCLFWYARRETISLAVGSKGGSSTPITISGLSSFGLSNMAAQRAFTAAPAQDAEPMIRELGAMVTDIQVLGDFGINKWVAGQTKSAPTSTQTVN